MEKIPLDIVEQLRDEEQQGILDSFFIEKNNSSSNNTKGKDSFKSLTSLVKIAEKSNAGIIITDNNGFIQFINHTYSKMTGYHIDDLKGKNVNGVESPSQPNANFDEIIEMISSGHVWMGELVGVRKNKETFWEQTTIIPIIHDQEEISHFFMIKNEITEQKQLQESLRIKENAILSSINAIVLTDLSGKINYVNPSFLKMWSFDSEKKVIGKPVFSLWRKGGEYVNIMDAVVTDGGWLGEVIARSQNGRLFPVQMSASIVKDEHNKPLSIMASFVDITKQKRMEKNFKKFKKISDEADYGSVIYDLNGNILYGNNAFTRMHGYHDDELIGKNISLLFKSQQQESLDMFLSDLKAQGKIVGVEQWHTHRNGTSFPLLVTSTIIDDEQFHQPFAAGTMIDITKMKEAEQQLIQHAEEVKLMNKELNVAREQLTILNENLEQKVFDRTKEIRKLMAQKDGFINQLGHDLRTPLTPMFALLPLLENRVVDEKGKKYVSMVEKNVHYMKDLVNKTITYAKLNSEKIQFNFEELNLFGFIESLKEELSVTLSERNGILINQIDPDCMVVADSLQLREVFENLISNSLKYKKKNEPVHLMISTKKLPDAVIISVEDDGLGMTGDQLANVFDEFYKADDARTDVDSHGLGLNICKRIIEKHQGSIWVDSQGFGKGSTFYFKLKNKIEDMKNEVKD